MVLCVKFLVSSRLGSRLSPRCQQASPTADEADFQRAFASLKCAETEEVRVRCSVDIPAIRMFFGFRMSLLSASLEFLFSLSVLNFLLVISIS